MYKVGDFVSRKSDHFTPQWREFVDGEPSKPLRVRAIRDEDVSFGDRFWWDSLLFTLCNTTPLFEKLKNRLKDGIV